MEAARSTRRRRYCALSVCPSDETATLRRCGTAAGGTPRPRLDLKRSHAWHSPGRQERAERELGQVCYRGGSGGGSGGRWVVCNLVLPATQSRSASFVFLVGRVRAFDVGREGALEDSAGPAIDRDLAQFHVWASPVQQGRGL